MNILHEFFTLLAEELCFRTKLEGDALTVFVHNPKQFAIRYFAEYASDYYDHDVIIRLYKVPYINDDTLGKAYVLIKEG